MIKKLNIAIVIRSFNRGGAEVLIREMFKDKKFVDHTGSCDLIILDKKNIELVSDLENINYYIFNFFSRSFISEYYKLYKLIKKKKYQVLHSHLPVAGILLRFLKFLLPQVKLVYSEHNVIDSYNKITFVLNGITFPKDNYTIFVSPEVQACIDKHRHLGFYNYKKASVVINGVDSNKFYSANKNNFYKGSLTVGTVVSFRKEKRLDRWIEVAETVKNNYPHLPIKFIMAGVGPEKKYIDQLISQKKLNTHIELPGLIIDTVAIYNKLDIFLMTSEFEGLPVALLEAMSCACIPLVSNVGGIKNLDFNGFGYKYETFNAQDVAKVIIQYYNDKSRIITERKKAREFILQNNSLDKQVCAYINIYNHL